MAQRDLAQLGTVECEHRFDLGRRCVKCFRKEAELVSLPIRAVDEITDPVAQIGTAERRAICRFDAVSMWPQPGNNVRFRAHGPTGLTMRVATRDDNDHVDLTDSRGRTLRAVPIELLEPAQEEPT